LPPHRDSRARTISLLVLFVFSALVLTFANLDFVLQLIPSSDSEGVARLAIRPAIKQLSEVKYARVTVYGTYVYQCRELIDIGDLGYGADSYGCTKKFFANDIFENLFQNVGQLISKWISEWVNGPIADAASWLSLRCLDLVKHPITAILRVDHFFQLMNGNAHAVGLTNKLVQGFACGLFVVISLFGSCRPKAGLLAYVKLKILHLISALLLIAGPVLLLTTTRIHEAFVSFQVDGCYTVYENFGKAVASSIKGGLMASAGMIAHLIAPLDNALVGGFWLGWIGESIALASLLAYLVFTGFYIAQLLVLLFEVSLQTFIILAHTLLGPIFLVCAAVRETDEFARGYVAAWLELYFWVVAWAVLFQTFVGAMFADLNPLFKLIVSTMLVQTMIFTPRAISCLRLSPMSKYMSMNPVSGFAFGIADLCASILQARHRFNQPR
jgi:hypothetical protein